MARTRTDGYHHGISPLSYKQQSFSSPTGTYFQNTHSSHVSNHTYGIFPFQCSVLSVSLNQEMHGARMPPQSHLMDDLGQPAARTLPLQAYAKARIICSSNMTAHKQANFNAQRGRNRSSDVEDYRSYRPRSELATDRLPELQSANTRLWFLFSIE